MYHNFRRFIKNKIIRICYIDTREQIVEIFTKPLDKSVLIYIQIKLSICWNLFFKAIGYQNTDIKLKLTTDQIEVVGCILECLIKGFSIIKTYDYHSSIFHTVFTETYSCSRSDCTQ